MYKANLSRISARYGDVERRVLNWFVDHSAEGFAVLPRELSLLMDYLVRDGIVTREVPTGTPIGLEAYAERHHYHLTEAGRAFVQRLREGSALE